MDNQDGSMELSSSQELLKGLYFIIKPYVYLKWIYYGRGISKFVNFFFCFLNRFSDKHM